jgi:hypothetical protein
VKSKVFCVWLCLCLSGAALANVVMEWPLEKKAKQSQLVVIGVAHSPSSASGKFGLDSVQINVETTLKGSPVKQVTVFFEDSGEEHPRCCEKGSRYIFFLHLNSQGLWYPVNGPHGIKSIPSDPNRLNGTELIKSGTA